MSLRASRERLSCRSAPRRKPPGWVGGFEGLPHVVVSDDVASPPAALARLPGAGGVRAAGGRGGLRRGVLVLWRARARRTARPYGALARVAGWPLRQPAAADEQRLARAEGGLPRQSRRTAA